MPRLSDWLRRQLARAGLAVAARPPAAPLATPRLSPLARERWLDELASRMPAALRACFEDATRQLDDGVCTDAALLDALDRQHAGLGIAIGRGQTGAEAEYEQLAQLVAWLYEALGRPTDTQYAMLQRVTARMAAEPPEQDRTRPD